MQPNPSPGNDFLESMGIVIETPIDENVLTSGTAENVRFRAVQIPNSNKTFGYVFNEVDKFVREIVAPSLKWYQTALHKRDLDVYNLAKLVDERTQELARAEKDLENARYNSQVRQGLEANQTDADLIDALNKLSQAKIDKEALEQHIGDLEAYIDQIKVAYDELEAKVLAGEGDDEIPSEDLTNLVPLSQYNELLERFNELSTQYTEDTTALQEQLDSVSDAGDTTEFENKIGVLEAENSSLNDSLDSLQQKYDIDTTSLQEQLSLALVSTPSVTEEDHNKVKQDLVNAQAQIEALQNHNDALSRQYHDEVETLQANSAAQANEQIGLLEAHIQSLEDYIAGIQKQYEDLQSEFEQSSNVSDVGKLKVELAASEAERERLEALLYEYAPEEEEVAPAPRLPLPTEQRNTSTPLPPEIKLPPGIRPDDL